MGKEISVVVPCFNAEQTVERCISSLIAQTYRNHEIIVVDDGSSDDTCKLIKKLAEKDERIILIEQSNRGVSAARNTGIENAQGNFISFVDADDFVERDYLGMLLSCIEGKDISICRYRSDSDRTDYTECATTVDGVIKEMMVPQQNIAAFVWNRLYRIPIIQDHAIRFNETVYACEDTLFNFIYMQYVNNVGICNEHLYHYVINSSSAMFGKKFNERKITANIAFDYMLRESEGKSYEEYIEIAAMWFNLILKRQIYKNGYMPTQMEMEIINRMLRLNYRAFMKAPISAKYKMAYPFWRLR